MSIISNLTARLPFVKKPIKVEYYFALNIGQEKISVGIWSIEHGRLKLSNIESDKYSSLNEIVDVVDKLLDKVVGDSPTEPEKILFGVPDSWLNFDDLKENYLKLIRSLVKELELKPLAYVSTSHAVAHYLEQLEGAPPTAILVGIENSQIEVMVVRAGKIDGVKVTKISDNIGSDIERELLAFTDVEVLPSRILIFSSKEKDLNGLKSDLLSFSWMSKLSFLHFPKIDILEDNVEIKAVSLAGAVEIEPGVKYVPGPSSEIKAVGSIRTLEEDKDEVADKHSEKEGELGGFVIGDVTKRTDEQAIVNSEQPVEETQNEMEEEGPISNPDLMTTAVTGADNFLPTETEHMEVPPAKQLKIGLRINVLLLVPILIFLILALGYLFLPKAQISIFVEPRVLERDTQVTADPNIKEVDEASKKIPGQVVETQLNGSDKIAATGKKKVGESAKGKVAIYNATNQPLNLNSGTTLVTDSGLKFTLDSGVQIASKSASAASPPSQSDPVGATANQIGADGNIPPDTELKVGNFSKTEVVAKAAGNFSGGTSKEVIVVSDEDRKKLLAQLAANIRKQATEQFQSQLKGKKILEEALSEEIIKKTYSKDINDQANEFSLNLTIKYKGTAYLEEDLKTIVAKLVETNVPPDFQLDLAETETQADVSKVDKDGKLIFLARFKAKLMPKVDTGSIKKKIRGKTLAETEQILKSQENILGSEIRLNPALPGPLQRIPLLENNITIEVGLK